MNSKPEDREPKPEDQGQSPRDPLPASKDLGSAADDPALYSMIEDYYSKLKRGEAPSRERFLDGLDSNQRDFAESHMRDFHFIFQQFGETRKAVSAGQILGDFRILEELGRGGMGVVWEAEQISLRRRVALKVLRPTNVREELASARFQAEAEIPASLNHPGIIQIYDRGECQGVEYIAQELVPGGRTLATLLHELRLKRAMPADHYRKMARLFRDAARALHLAHQVPVIHRDIKPSNLLLTADLQPKIGDFGLARMEGDLGLTRTGDLLGTAYYMSPEQTRGISAMLDFRTDIFSLGTTFYEALVLNRPFEGDSTTEVLGKIREQEPVQPTTLRAKLPKDLETICLKALRKRPENRYSSMEAFADDLQRFLEGMPIQARPPTWWQRSIRLARRHPIASTALMTASVALLVIVILATKVLQQGVQLNRRTEELLMLADQNTVQEIIEESHRLWPAVPSMAGKMEDWLQRAETFIQERRPFYQSVLAKFESGTFQLRPVGFFPGSGDWQLQRQWWIEQIGELIGKVESLEGPDGLLARVRQRLHLARNLPYWTMEEPGIAESWRQAVARIAADPRFAGLEFEPQMGLIPLGPDPETGLEEFAHYQSGEIPIRDTQGKLLLRPEMALVFVLIPGGHDRLGVAHQAREDSDQFDLPARNVEFEPFFISKFEMTQGQWLNVQYENPAFLQPGMEASLRFDQPDLSLLHPVEQVHWNEVVQCLETLELRLPNEDEWEYAARAGADGKYLSGDDFTQLQGSENFGDLSFVRGMRFPDWCVVDWDDGWATHSPVGYFKANAFGLYDVHGNVAEYCAISPADQYDHGPGDCFMRGGNYWFDASIGQYSFRFRIKKKSRSGARGLRPARSIRNFTE
ncbi:MAG: hypothetical protein DWQ01_08155 [Planctomycetota bacterium]|nr:MAG: hypothetical protein DWQ01_08155 [Planctomycetota bacterium]